MAQHAGGGRGEEEGWGGGADGSPSGVLGGDGEVSYFHARKDNMTKGENSSGLSDGSAIYGATVSLTAARGADGRTCSAAVRGADGRAWR